MLGTSSDDDTCSSSYGRTGGQVVIRCSSIATEWNDWGQADG